jgi:hypothetical protein
MTAAIGDQPAVYRPQLLDRSAKPGNNPGGGLARTL